MKSPAFGALVALAFLALNVRQTADAALCMCHPSSCLLINPHNEILNVAELHCPMNKEQITDLMIVRFNEKSLPVGSFGSFPNLTSVEIFQGMLTSIEPGAFEKVPFLEKIIIRNNQIKTLANNTFRGLDRLEILFIFVSALSSIAPNAFDGLKNLTHLSMSGSKLTQLPETLFASTPALKTISFANNHIANSLPGGLFDNLEELFRLDLSHNHLNSFDFPRLKLLQLHLNNNTLTSLYLGEHYTLVQAEQNRISKLSGPGSKLRNLVLSENALSDISSISHMTTITKLGLSGNPLQADTVFNGLTGLEELLLSNTNIRITEKTFAKLEELKLLDLSYNNLTKIDFSMLSGLIELQTLVLAFNRIEKINFVEQREYLPKLRVLEICGNGWNNTYLDRVLEHMRLYKLKADMHGLAHALIFKDSYVELCSTQPEGTNKSSLDEDYYSEDISDIMNQDIADLFASTSPSSTTTRGTTTTRTPTTTVAVTTAKAVTAATTSQAPQSTEQSARVIPGAMSAAIPPADAQPTVSGSSPLFVTFQVIVYTFAVFGIVALGVVAYYMRQRRAGLRSIVTMSEVDSVRLV